MSVWTSDNWFDPEEDAKDEFFFAGDADHINPGWRSSGGGGGDDGGCFPITCLLLVAGALWLT